mmetsp:Transcript_21842/g.62164  ORF Transcript_21842/g.62164 Transcript_21842/m.62164 type:complete len:228 (-) Transcript_21842:1455-2138(-)
MSDSAVKVAVRVRPFNQREKGLDAVCCIAMAGPTTTINDVDGGTGEETFTFDYSFWSHDGFAISDEGLLIPEDGNSPYVDQKKVFDCLGVEVLNNAWTGYHCCLFAYGQTGAGKSYSMVGFGPNKGIIPTTCQDIFRRIGENHDPAKHFEVTIGMLEIYNEKIQDLLIHANQRTKVGSMRTNQVPVSACGAVCCCALSGWSGGSRVEAAGHLRAGPDQAGCQQLRGY